MISYNQQYDKYLQIIEFTLKEKCIKYFYNDSSVSKAAKYSLLNGGKRVRAVLSLAVCEMLCGDFTCAVDFACAVEFIHCYSLIHDDLPCMDNDDMRRGKPSCHIEFSEDTAMLAGDALLTAAFEIAADASIKANKIVNAIKILSQMSGAKGMIYGQELDLFYENKNADEKQLCQIYNNKTGCLINAAIILGAIAGGANNTQIKKLNEYAYAIGLSFQITDDILDIISTQDELGKPIGSDGANEKSTFVSLIGLEKAKEKADALTQKACKNIDGFNNSEFLKQFALNLSVRKK